MTPQGATHKLNAAHVDSCFFNYVKIDNGIHYSYNSNGWFVDKSIERFMNLYSKIESVDYDSEDACFNAIENKIECNGVLDENS